MRWYITMVSACSSVYNKTFYNAVLPRYHNTGELMWYSRLISNGLKFVCWALRQGGFNYQFSCIWFYLARNQITKTFSECLTSRLLVQILTIIRSHYAITACCTIALLHDEIFSLTLFYNFFTRRTWSSVTLNFTEMFSTVELLSTNFVTFNNLGGTAFHGFSDN